MNQMRRSRRSGFYFIAIALVLSPVELWSAQPGGRGPSRVDVSRVEMTRKPASKSFVGSLVPLKRSPLGSAIDGRVVQMFVEEGDAVTVDESQLVDGEKLGQPLIQLRTVSLDIEIDAAQIELQLRQQAEKEIQASLPTEIAGAQSAVEEIKARLKFSQENSERLKKLYESGGGVSQQEVDEAISTYLSQKQLKVGVETQLNKLIATRDSRLQQARFKVEAQDAELRRLKELKSNYTIRAPFPGYVTSKQTELGQWVAKGETVLEVIQVDPIELVVPVPQEFIQPLQDSMEECRDENKRYKVQVMVDSLPHLLEGEIANVVPQADLRSRSFPVKIRIDNPKIDGVHLLKSGMIAQAFMFLGNDEDIFLVHKDALVLDIASTSLYVVSTDEESKKTVAKRVQVQVGASIEDWIQVIGLDDELHPGDQVVVRGNERLMAGQEIAVARELSEPLPDVLQFPKPPAKN